jgi:DNA-binding response OmpR family regulator
VEENVQRKTIVVVEDNDAIAQLVKELLSEEMDCETLVAGDGLVGLETIRAEKPQLVILDVGLPGLDGFQVYDAIRSDDRLKLTPVLFLTASDYPLSFFLSRNIEHCLRKPFDLDDLLTEVHQLMGRVKVDVTAQSTHLSDVPLTQLS